MIQKLKKFYFLREGLLPKIILFSTMLVIITLFTSTFFLSQILNELMEDQLGKRALAISKTISMMPEVIELVEKDDPNDKLQKIILQISKSIDAQFIVIGDENSIRLTHPDEEKIGKKMVGEDNNKALLEGEYYISKGVGTLGPSIRGKSPIFNADGEIIGIVSVGYLETKVKKLVQQYHNRFSIYLYFAAFFIIITASLLSKKIKRSLLGYEPQEISRLFLEKQAILNSVKEGIITTDKEGNITLFNEVARNYFHLTDASKTPPPLLQKFLLTWKEMRDINIEIEGVEYICNSFPLIQNNHTIGMVASCRKKEEIDVLVWELTRVKQYSERLREKKHEFSNLLHLISGHIQIGEYDKAIALITKDHQPDEKVIDNFQEAIQNPTVASIFIGKYYFAFEKGVKITLDENSSIQEAIHPCIEKHLSTILGNIINNAIDAAKHSEKKEVILFATDIGNDLIFEIEDSGSGIDKSMLDKIFEKGFTTKGKLHSGYGLFFVKNTLEWLNGFVSISKGNYGTIVAIHIPKGARYD